MSPSHREESARPVLRASAAARVGAALLLVGGVVAVRALAPGTTIELPDAPGTTSAAATGSEASGAGAPAGSEASASAGTEVGPVVHVTGAVPQPGLYELDPGARVADAITAAGGMAAEADESALNLAAPLEDGTQIYVPRVGEDPPPAVGPAPGSPAEAGPVNLNTADAAALATLPGIGPALADRIIAFREANGPFGTVADLDAVSGIGPAILAQIDGKATV